jgi:hypothetical protein
MSSLLNKPIVLVLNSAWQRIGWTTVKDAVIAMCGKPGGTPPSRAIDLTLDANGELINAVEVEWTDWIKLPIRKGDLELTTARGAIRCPLVLVQPTFSEMPLRTPKLSNRAILERDGYVDQYTGEKLRPEEANVDHVIPRDVWKKRGLKGSPNTFENMVCCHKKRNFNKGNKLNAAAGLVLMKKPKAPKRVPVSYLINEGKHPHHTPFITK